MSLISFFKDAGEKLFGKKAQASQSEATADPAAIATANREAATAIENYISSMGLTATGLTVTYDGASATAKVYGIAKDQATKEKIICRFIESNSLKGNAWRSRNCLPVIA